MTNINDKDTLNKDKGAFGSTSSSQKQPWQSGTDQQKPGQGSGPAKNPGTPSSK